MLALLSMITSHYDIMKISTGHNNFAQHWCTAARQGAAANVCVCSQHSEERENWLGGRGSIALLSGSV